MKSKYILGIFIISVLIITTIVVIIVFKSRKKQELPFYMVDARKRSDAPIKIGVNKQETNSSKRLVEKYLKLAVNEYNERLNFELFKFDDSTELNLDKIYVSIEPSEHGCKSHFDGRMGTLAHANTPGTRICLDIDEDWENNLDMLKKTLIHEMGHAIGLRHIKDRPSIMTTYYNNIPDTLTDLDVRDINIMLDRKNINTVKRINYKQT